MNRRQFLQASSSAMLAAEFAQSELLTRTKNGPVGTEVENYKKAPAGGALPAHRDGGRA